MSYQAECRKLPKALRDWPAYNACRKTIDDFLEMLPLFQALTHKSMRERHWKDVMKITSHEFSQADDVFKLQVRRGRLQRPRALTRPTYLVRAAFCACAMHARLLTCCVPTLSSPFPPCPVAPAGRQHPGFPRGH
jgi:hypothetical protein